MIAIDCQEIMTAIVLLDNVAQVAQVEHEDVPAREQFAMRDAVLRDPGGSRTLRLYHQDITIRQRIGRLPTFGKECWKMSLLEYP